MAGTVTITEERIAPIHKVTFVWLSSAGGAADGTTTGYYNGEIVRVVQIPDAAATQPTDQYDVIVTDDDNADALVGLGANLSNAATVQKVAADKLGTVANAQLTLGVTNAGNAKGGKTILYIKVV
jgi:hypothetical protein